MIIKEIDNITYQINLPNSNINIYNKDSLERITKKIFKKITNKKGDNTMITRTEQHYLNKIASLRSKGEEQNINLIRKAKRNLRKLQKSGT